MSQFLTGPNYLALPRTTQPWLIDRLIPTGGLANLYGKPKSKKSFLALHMAAAIGNPLVKSWEGFPVNHHGDVVYLQIDTPRTAWGSRMSKLTQLNHSFDRVWFADMQMVPSYPFNCLDPLALKWLADELVRIHPVLIVIDTLREAHGADENDSTAMRNVITQLVKCAIPISAGMLFLSHQKKDSAFMKQGGDDLMDDARGSSYVAGRMDNVMRLTESRLTWKGRMGEGSVTVKWDPKTLALGVDPTTLQNADMALAVLDEQRAINPGVLKSEVGKAICDRMGWDPKNASDLRRATRLLDDLF